MWTEAATLTYVDDYEYLFPLNAVEVTTPTEPHIYQTSFMLTAYEETGPTQGEPLNGICDRLFAVESRLTGSVTVPSCAKTEPHASQSSGGMTSGGSATIAEETYATMKHDPKGGRHPFRHI